MEIFISPGNTNNLVIDTTEDFRLSAGYGRLKLGADRDNRTRR